MPPLNFIRKYYQPLQPTVRAEDEVILYREVQPTNDLLPCVYCFWQLKTRKRLPQPFLYRVVSDGCIDIFFEPQQPAQSFVMGFCRKYTEFPIGQSFDYIGIRFLPAAFPLLFGIDAKVLSNQAQALELILPEFAQEMAAQIKPTQSFESIVAWLSEKVRVVLERNDIQMDARFYKALKLIFEKKGFLDTEKDLVVGLSPRQLRRIFNWHLGTTSKSFSNVVRFQHILNAGLSQQNLKANKLYFDVGFYDQSHFIKNFKTFYGVTPSEAFH